MPAPVRSETCKYRQLHEERGVIIAPMGHAGKGTGCGRMVAAAAPAATAGRRG